jgi:hypothetical protein
MAVEVVHRWLRLLLLYHSPELAQHLDRILPGWEQPAKDVSTSEVYIYTKSIHISILLMSVHKYGA